MEAGGRTGLTAVVVGICFLLALIFFPVISSVAGYAPITSSALVAVGAMMMRNVTDIDWQEEDFAARPPRFAFLQRHAPRSQVRKAVAAQEIRQRLPRQIPFAADHPRGGVDIQRYSIQYQRVHSFRPHGFILIAAQFQGTAGVFRHRPGPRRQLPHRDQQGSPLLHDRQLRDRRIVQCQLPFRFPDLGCFPRRDRKFQTAVNLLRLQQIAPLPAVERRRAVSLFHREVE